MAWRQGLAAVSLGALAGVAAHGEVAAQDPAAMAAIRHEIEAIKSHHANELQRLRSDYERRIADLEARVNSTMTPAAGAAARAPAGQTPTRIASSSAPAAPIAQAPVPTPAGRPAVLGVEPVGVRGHEPLTGNRPPRVPTADNSFNPAIGVVLNGAWSRLSRDPASYAVAGFPLGEEVSPGRRGFSIGESEITFGANVDRFLYAALTVALTEENEAEVEEAFIQTRSLPWGFTLKGGRFFSGIGYLNQFHAHDWDFVDEPLPYRAFLNKQLSDDGVQVRWVAPIQSVLFEIGGEALRGDSFPAFGAQNHGVGSWSSFAHAGFDIGDSHSIRLGGSFLDTRAENRETGSLPDIFSGATQLWIADAVYRWAPDGNPTRRNLRLQAEYFTGKTFGDFNAIDYSARQSGWYAQAVYQFMPQWRLGMRYDRVRTNSPVGPELVASTVDPLGHRPHRYTGMVEFNTSEFGRLRLQYNRDNSRIGQADNQVTLQYTVNIGFHPSHLF